MNPPPLLYMRTHSNPKGLRLTKQRGVATALWLHHWTGMWSSKEIQTFPNLLLNKLAAWRGADRPFIAAGAGPMACMDRLLCFDFLSWPPWQMSYGGRRQSSNSQPQSFTSCQPLCPQHVLPHSHPCCQEPHGSQRWKLWRTGHVKVKYALTLCAHTLNKAGWIYGPIRWWWSKLLSQHHWVIKAHSMKGGFW